MDFLKLDEIARVGSRLSKEKILQTLGSETVKFLAKALDPMITFGVTADEDHLLGVWRRGKQEWTPDVYWDAFYALLESLQSRRLTGNDAQRQIEALISNCFREEAVIWTCRILNKNLRMGVQVTTLNEVFPGTVQEWNVALAETYDPDKDVLQGEYVREPKLDGLRGVAFKGKMYTRNGRIIESVDHVLEELRVFEDTDVFDGEIMGAKDFDESSGDIRRKGEGPNKELYYNVFDVVDLEGWMNRDTYSLRKRKERLDEIFELSDFKYVRRVPWTKMNLNPTAVDVVAAGDAYIADGYEGAMIKNLDSQYIFDRSKALLKVKRFVELDGKIAGVYEGKGRLKKTLGGIFVEHPAILKDGLGPLVQTKVGSGFSDSQRADLWKRADEIFGKTVEIKYQNPTAEGRLRFPVFLRFRPDKD